MISFVVRDNGPGARPPRSEATREPTAQAVGRSAPPGGSALSVDTFEAGSGFFHARDKVLGERLAPERGLD